MKQKAFELASGAPGGHLAFCMSCLPDIQKYNGKGKEPLAFFQEREEVVNEIWEGLMSKFPDQDAIRKLFLLDTWLPAVKVKKNGTLLYSLIGEQMNIKDDILHISPGKCFVKKRDLTEVRHSCAEDLRDTLMSINEVLKDFLFLDFDFDPKQEDYVAFICRWKP